MNRCRNYGVRRNSLEINCLPALYTLPSRAKAFYTDLDLGSSPIRCRQLQSASPVDFRTVCSVFGLIFSGLQSLFIPHRHIVHLFDSFAVKTEGDL